MNEIDRERLEKLDDKLTKCEQRIEEVASLTVQTALAVEDLRDNHIHTLQGSINCINKIVNLENEKSPLYITLNFIKINLSRQWKALALGLGLIAVLLAIVEVIR